MKDHLHLINIIKKISFSCSKLVKQSFGYYLPCAGNVGVFCQSDEEYESLTKLKNQLTESYGNPNQKYFHLKEPIVIASKNGIPEMIYTHLYIRKPDPTPYGKYKGDVDFVMPPEEYDKLKKSLLDGDKIEGAQIYDRPGWDTIQVTNPGINSVAYVSTKEFAEKLRVRF